MASRFIEKRKVRPAARSYELKAVMRVEYGKSGKLQVLTIPLHSCTDIKFIVLNPRKARANKRAKRG